MQLKLHKLAKSLAGELFTDTAIRLMYATDASIYKEIPLAVARPKNIDDVKQLIVFANQEKTSLVFRGAGTSLAGQCVGNGIIVDVSKYLNKILQLNVDEHWVKVQPGVILYNLNRYLEPYNLFFAPDPSTDTRCVIGGMVGNNSSGAHSLIYGSTREHLLEINAILSDATEATFKFLSNKDFENKLSGNTLENQLYRNIYEILSSEINQQMIEKEYPLPTVRRRNTGFALDLLLNTKPFRKNADDFNFCKLLAGSEGTLAFFSEIKLNLVTLPPKEKALVCAHFNSLDDALYANLIALKFQPSSIELIDKTLLSLTKDNIAHQKNRFFVYDEPAAILIVAFCKTTKDEIDFITKEMQAEMRKVGLGYHFPVVYGHDINKVWNLRKAGLGILSTLKGDAKPISFIEDTAIDVNLLPQYISDLKQILKDAGLSCTFYGHIGAGELHIKPIINLKTTNGMRLLREISEKVAHLVKKYKGSLSGEHGDGRLRSEFIKKMLGEHIYNLLTKIKQTWDKNNIFNPGKIVQSPPIEANLRYHPLQKTPDTTTIFDFSATEGIIRALENCNGSADCRKTEIAGGIMCPSYMATTDEWHSTRARAIILKEFLTNSVKTNPFNHKEIYDVLDLCLSCKGCMSECPSNIDIAKFKAEFLQHYYDDNPIPLRSWLFAHISQINNLSIKFRPIYNLLLTRKNLLSQIIKKILGIAPNRTLPPLHPYSFRSWVKKNKPSPSEKPSLIKGKVYLFCDEFTNYYDVEIGIKALKLLIYLGYEVVIPEHRESGRTCISKGLLRKAKKIAIENVLLLKDIITNESPLIGIEPSAILTFRDEYPNLVYNNLKQDALNLAKNTLMIDEFLCREIEKGNITRDGAPVRGIENKQKIKLYGHCHQRVLASIEPTKKVLSYLGNYEVEVISAGCCGMAGAFGYEKEHYDISMKIGELVIFPTIRHTDKNAIIVASGTSCRQQIKDGTGRRTFHPIEVLYEAMFQNVYNEK